ncbi:MAG TPA: class D sortase [Dongiaceae bacterium]|nr:class D sortase [Dongiaceae bacterium]
MKAPVSHSHAGPIIRRAERIVFALGLLLILVWGSTRIYQSAASRAAIARFQENVAGASAQNLSPAVDPAVGSKVDFQLWSSKRIAAYIQSLSQKNDLPLAVLRIPALKLQVPVFNGTDDLTLDRGVGRILGTAQIGQPGNLGIAGHRDGFFRVLKDIHAEDLIQLEERGKTQEYVVTQTQVVNPEDTHVLAPTTVPTLTLVTCFPFYFVGSAPQRYIVTAVMKNSSRPD